MTTPDGNSAPTPSDGELWARAAIAHVSVRYALGRAIVELGSYLTPVQTPEEVTAQAQEPLTSGAHNDATWRAARAKELLLLTHTYSELMDLAAAHGPGAARTPTPLRFDLGPDSEAAIAAFVKAYSGWEARR